MGTYEFAVLPEILIKDQNELLIRSLILEDGFSTIGREPNNAIVLDHPSVSRDHGAFFLRERFGILLVEDHGSTNGTFVNGMRVKRAILYTGDIVQMGDFQCYIRHGSTVPNQPAKEAASIRKD